MLSAISVWHYDAHATVPTYLQRLVWKCARCALVAGLVASPTAATTADHPFWHMGFWISQFGVSGFDIESGLLLWDISVLGIMVPLVMASSR